MSTNAEHSHQPEHEAHDPAAPDAHRDQHAGHGIADDHGGHSAHAGHGGHAGHGDHVGQFRRLFWVNLVLAVPVVAFSAMFAMIVGYELPRDGLVPPGVFIPIAEESDLIVSLGDWVLVHACGLLAQPAFRERRLRLSVNLSARQFRQAGFVPQVRALLAGIQDTRGE